MSASAILGYSMVAIDDQSGVIAAVITTGGLIVVAVINNMSESRRHKRELRYRGGGRGRSGANTFLLAAILISVMAGIYFVQRPAKETNASFGPDETTAPPAETTPSTTAVSTTSVPTSPATTAPTTVACPLALSVQVSARVDDDPVAAEFMAEADRLVQRLPQLGELHTRPGADCGAPSSRILFYFGPFADEAAALDACLGIGQILHDEITTFTTFVLANGVTDYPFYRTQLGARALDSSGETFLCNPS